jgi:O-antigen/teichoic acid export membrane protein
MNFIKASRTYLQNFFSRGHSRTVAAKKNIAGSFVIKGISIAISFLLVPLTIDYINPTQYGIWLTLSSMIAWIGFFDIGFGHGLRNRLAETIAKGDHEQAREYISTTYAILAIIFGALFLVFLVLNFFIRWDLVLNAPSVMENELSETALLVFGFLCLQMVFKIISAIVLADQKPSLSNLVLMLGQLLGLGFIFVLSKVTGGSLVKLGFALGSSQALVLAVASVILFRGRYSRYRPVFSCVRFSKAPEILNLGIKFFLIQISAIVIFQTTNVVISHILGPVYVTTYNVAYKYFFAIAMVFTIILTPFWSAFTDAFTRGDFKWMRMTVGKLKKVWLMIIPVALLMVAVSALFYRIWVGDKVQVPFIVSALLAVHVLLFTRFSLFVYLINGIGKVQLQLYVNIAIASSYIPLAVYFSRWMGLPGIIAANILVSLIHAIVSQVQVTRILNDSASGIWNK